MRQPVSHITVIALIVLVAACNWTMAATGTESDNPPETAPMFWGIPPAHLQALHVGPDQETLNYLLPRLTAKYRPSDAWMGVTDPRFYVLSELENQQDDDFHQENSLLDRNEKLQKRDSKLGRNGPSLSIVQPLDVLRQRMLLEIARRKALQQVKQVAANREYLENIGKRNGLATRQAQSRNALQYDSL